VSKDESPQTTSPPRLAASSNQGNSLGNEAEDEDEKESLQQPRQPQRPQLPQRRRVTTNETHSQLAEEKKEDIGGGKQGKGRKEDEEVIEKVALFVK
jgi:hypothetical protein